MHTPVCLDDFLRGPLARRAAILADLDGCLVSGTTVLPHVVGLLERCAGRVWIVSNNSAETSVGLSLRLAALGLAIDPAHIFWAGEETLRAIAAQRPGARVALFCAPALHQLAIALGLRADRQSPDVAFLARDPAFSFADLTELVALVHRGVPIRLSNPDPTHPAADGTPLPETGALWAALACAVPEAVHECLGKPAPDMVRRALARAGVLPGAAVFIGDTAATDGAAAAAAGVDFVLLRRPGAARVAQAGAVRC